MSSKRHFVRCENVQILEVVEKAGLGCEFVVLVRSDCCEGERLKIVERQQLAARVRTAGRQGFGPQSLRANGEAGPDAGECCAGDRLGLTDAGRLRRFDGVRIIPNRSFSGIVPQSVEWAGLRAARATRSVAAATVRQLSDVDCGGSRRSKQLRRFLDK